MTTSGRERPIDISTIVSTMVERMILFGSRASGDAKAGSDVDLLIVMPEGTGRREAAVEIRRSLQRLPVAKDIVVTTPDHTARRGPVIGTVLHPALREGEVLYQRAWKRVGGAALVALCPRRS